jgi:hypothetical protein
MIVIARWRRRRVSYSGRRTPAARRGPGGTRWARRAVTGPLAVVGTAVALIAGAGTAWAAPALSVPLGADVSYPQCGSPLPSGHAFALVGVNGGKPTTTNPCLQVQLAWGRQAVGGTVHDDVQLYVNTANPGGLGVTTWPRSGITRYGACEGSNSLACAYRYGWERAREDATIRGVSHPEQYMWWLDVETANTWDYSSGGRARNAAVLEGMTDYFTSIGTRGVGLYSTRHQWGLIVGDGLGPASSLIGLPNWRPTGSTLAGARAGCALAPLTPGGVIELAQFTTDRDYNYSCI